MSDEGSGVSGTTPFEAVGRARMSIDSFWSGGDQSIAFIFLLSRVVVFTTTRHIC